MLTLVESILENPDVVLRKQLDQLKTEKMAELKAAGVEYEQRIEELEKLEWPKPNRDFIYDTFNAFADAHPWVGQENIGPKSIAREMYEGFASFDDYVRSYGLQRSEGVLLRYLSQVYKTMAETVPVPARTEEVMDILAHFRALLREVDTSLIEEWESLTQPRAGAAAAARPRARPSIRWRSGGRCTPRIRAELHKLVRALARRDYAGGGARCWRRATGEAWTAERLDRRDGAVLGRAHRAADDARRAPRPIARASTSSGRAACASSRRWSTPRATRTGRSTASSTCDAADAPRDRRCSESGSDGGSAGSRLARDDDRRARRAGRRARRGSPRRRRAGRR